jgi:hypothetical protein
VKSQNTSRWAIALLLAASLPAVADKSGFSKDDKKDNKAKTGSQVIDSGTFGVFKKGQRVINETFKVEQENGASVIKSQLKLTAANDLTSQDSDLEITPSGDLVRYTWSQNTGGSLSVMPNNDFLMEKITAPGTTKAAEQSFLMPSSTAVLDNNFFIQREIFAWRYLAANCKSEGSGLKCQQGPADFGVLVPQDRNSLRVKMEVIGNEKVAIRGAQRDLLRVNLTGEDFQWSLWLDSQDHYKLIRVTIPADDMEVVRD